MPGTPLSDLGEFGLIGRIRERLPAPDLRLIDIGSPAKLEEARRLVTAGELRYLILRQLQINLRKNLRRLICNSLIVNVVF